MNGVELNALAPGAPGVDLSRYTAVVTTVSGADPAANAEVTITVPALTWYVLLAVTVNLVATVQTPLPNLVLTDGTSEFFSAPGASAVSTAGVTSQFTWAPTLSLTAGAALTRNYAPIPVGIILPPGYKITTVTTGLGANCNYGVPVAYVRKYS